MSSKTPIIYKVSQNLRMRLKLRKRNYYLYMKKLKHKFKLCEHKTNFLGNRKPTQRSAKIRLAVWIRHSVKRRKNSKQRKRSSVNLLLK